MPVVLEPAGKRPGMRAAASGDCTLLNASRTGRAAGSFSGAASSIAILERPRAMPFFSLVTDSRPGRRGALDGIGEGSYGAAVGPPRTLRMDARAFSLRPSAAKAGLTAPRKSPLLREEADSLASAARASTRWRRTQHTMTTQERTRRAAAAAATMMYRGRPPDFKTVTATERTMAPGASDVVRVEGSSPVASAIAESMPEMAVEFTPGANSVERRSKKAFPSALESAATAIVTARPAARRRALVVEFTERMETREAAMSRMLATPARTASPIAEPALAGRPSATSAEMPANMRVNSTTAGSVLVAGCETVGDGEIDGDGVGVDVGRSENSPPDGVPLAEEDGEADGEPDGEVDASAKLPLRVADAVPAAALVLVTLAPADFEADPVVMDDADVLELPEADGDADAEPVGVGVSAVGVALNVAAVALAVSVAVRDERGDFDAIADIAAPAEAEEETVGADSTKFHVGVAEADADGEPDAVNVDAEFVAVGDAAIASEDKLVAVLDTVFDTVLLDDADAREEVDTVANAVADALALRDDADEGDPVLLAVDETGICVLLAVGDGDGECLADAELEIVAADELEAFAELEAVADVVAAAAGIADRDDEYVLGTSAEAEGVATDEWLAVAAPVAELLGDAGVTAEVDGLADAVPVSTVFVTVATAVGDGDEEPNGDSVGREDAEFVAVGDAAIASEGTLVAVLDTVLLDDADAREEEDTVANADKDAAAVPEALAEVDAEDEAETSAMFALCDGEAVAVPVPMAAVASEDALALVDALPTSPTLALAEVEARLVDVPDARAVDVTVFVALADVLADDEVDAATVGVVIADALAVPDATSAAFALREAVADCISRELVEDDGDPDALADMATTEGIALAEALEEALPDGNAVGDAREVGDADPVRMHQLGFGS